MSEKQELLPLSNGEAEAITIETTDDLISIAQRRLDTVKRLIDLSLKITTPQDWLNQAGKPYLVHSGAEKVARLFGVKLSGLDTKKEWAEDTKGRYYIYRTVGTAALPGRFDSIEALGTCSQRDVFFGKTSGEARDSFEIDETNIMKASYSNFIVNAITHLLGLRNITWQQLEGAGIKQADIQKIEYQKGAEKLAQTLSGDAQSNKKQIWNICLQLAAGDEDEANLILADVSRFKTKEGKIVEAKDLNRLSTEKWIEMTLHNAKAKFEKAYPKEPVPGA